MNKEQMCPFCPLQGIDESEYQPIGNDFYGEPARIGGVASCAECAMVAEITDSAGVMLAELNEARARVEIEGATMLSEGTAVRIQPVHATSCDWWWKVGTIEIIDPYTDGNDFYGVKFPDEARHPFFNAEELEVVSEQQPQTSANEEPEVGSEGRSKHVMQIVLASQSAVKVRAVEQAIKRLGLNAQLVAVKASSNVNEQPFEDETLEGAANRAAHAVMLQPGADYYLAIESGLFQREGEWYDIAVVVLRDESGQYIVHHSKGVCFPRQAVEECKRRGPQIWTVGKILVEMGYATQHDDPHKDIAGVSRADYINEVVYRALRGLTNK